MSASVRSVNIQPRKAALKIFKRVFSGQSFLVLILFFQLAPLPSYGANICDDLFRESAQAASDADPVKSQSLSGFLAGPLAQAMLKRPVTQRMAEILYSQMLMTEGQRHGPLSLGPPLKFYGSYAVRNRVLEFRIPIIELVLKGRALPIGSRPRGLDLQFAVLVTALSQAARTFQLTDPDIEQVKFIADEIENPGLPEVLAKLGLRPGSSGGESMELILLP